jgi:hypothetical protein
VKRPGQAPGFAISGAKRRPAVDVLLLLALVAFLAGAVVAGIQKSWPIVLLCAGLFLATLAETGLIAS